MIEPNEDKTKMLAPIYDISGNIIDYEDVCPYFEVSKIIKKIPDNQASEVEIKFQSGTRKGTIRIDSETLASPNKIINICYRNLFIIKSYYRKEVAEMIIDQSLKLIEENVNEYEHTILGWKNFGNKKVFLLEETKLPNGCISKCTREFGRFTSGTEEKYDKMLNSFVFTYPQMSLAYCIGFASVVSGLISEYRDLGIPIVGLTGRSTTGKTTALKLIASIWGDSNEAGGTVILKNKGSDVGFNAQYAGLFGFPICFDDIDTNQKLNMEDFLYYLSQGTQRIVANISGEATFKRLGFSGMAIMTGENPLTERTSQKMGLYARIIELNEVTWTSSGYNSTAIKNCICNNYGFKGKRFVKFIENKSLNDLLNQFDDCKKKVENNLNRKDKFVDRTAKKIALILQTIQLVNECFDLSLNEDTLISYVLKAEIEQQNKRNRSKLAYEFMYNYYKANKSRFDIREKRGNIISLAESTREGVALIEEDRVDLYIPITTARRILKINSFPQITNYQVEWKENGYTKCENGRYDKSNTELGRHYHFVYEFSDKTKGEK